MTIHFSCGNCGQPYPVEGVPYCCPTCGGIYSLSGSESPAPGFGDSGEPGIWRFRNTFGFSDDMVPVSLGEGNTPLVWVKVNGRSVGLKCEFLNPTGSFKDRGSSLIASFLKSRRVQEAVEDSSGNAGASFAAYATRAGIKARVYVPESASGPKRQQIEAYGADLKPVKGTRSNVTESALAAVHKGLTYASHAYLPFNIPGYATIVFEIYEQLKEPPGTVILPAGQGGLFLGIIHGVKTLRIGNTNKNLPVIMGVQAQACAPLCIPKQANQQNLKMKVLDTIAEGVKVPNPVRKEEVFRETRNGFGKMCTVKEDSILKSRDELARMGFYIEPTSAIVWPVLKREIKNLPDPIIVILTGSGYKYG